MIVGVGFHPLEQIEAAHVSGVQAEVEHHAVEMLLVQLGERFLRRRDSGNLDIIMRNQLDDAFPLCLIVLDHQQVLRNAIDERGDAREGGVEAFFAHRLLQIGNSAGLQSCSSLLDTRDDVHRHMPRFRITLQSIENLESIHPRHVDIERDRVRPNFTCRLESRLAIELDDALVPLVARHVQENFGEVLIILDHQHRAVAFFDMVAVVGDHRLRHRSPLGPILQCIARKLAPLIASERTSHRCTG